MAVRLWKLSGSGAILDFHIADGGVLPFVNHDKFAYTAACLGAGCHRGPAPFTGMNCRRAKNLPRAPSRRSGQHVRCH